jgi:hypothetical protein
MSQMEISPLTAGTPGPLALDPGALLLGLIASLPCLVLLSGLWWSLTSGPIGGLS